MTYDKIISYLKKPSWKDGALNPIISVSSQSISKSGVDPAFFNELSNYGSGFYTASDESKAREYAELTAEATGQRQELLGVKLNASNPAVFTSGTDFLVSSEQYVRDVGLSIDEPALEYSKYLRSQGYDAIEIESLGYVVVFEPEQVVVVEREIID